MLVATCLGKSIDITSSTKADKVFGRLVVDICEKRSGASIGGKQYMLLIYDDFSRFTWTYFMRQKLDNFVIFCSFWETNAWQETPQQ